MRRVLSLVLIWCLIPYAQGTGTNRLVVTFFNKVDAVRSPKILRTAQATNGFSVVKQYGRRLVLSFSHPVTVEQDGADVIALIDRVMGKGLVQLVELDYKVGISEADEKVGVSQMKMTVDDVIDVSAFDMPDYAANYNEVVGMAQEEPLWNIKDGEPYGIRAEPIWQITNSTPDVVVAVVDSGLAAAALDVFLNVAPGYDFISDPDLALDGDERDEDATDPGDYGPDCPMSSWHGTRVASILAARHDYEGNLGMKGVAQNCTVMPVRVLGECRTGYASDVADAIVWAAGGEIVDVNTSETPAKIIMMAFSGMGACPGYLQSAVTQATNLGAILIAAAGNNGKDASMYFPGNCNGTLVIAASTRQGTLAPYSNFGPTVDIAAPGGDWANAIMALGVDQDGINVNVQFGVGTSFAVPHVSGLAAMAVSEGWNERELKMAIPVSVQDLYNSCNGCDFGVIHFGFLFSHKAFNFTQNLLSDATFDLNANYSHSNELVGAAVDFQCSPGTRYSSNYNSQTSSSTQTLFSFLCPLVSYLCFFQAWHNGDRMTGVNVGCCYPDGSFSRLSNVYGGTGSAVSGGWMSPGTKITWSLYGFRLPEISVSWGTPDNQPYITTCPENQYLSGIYGSYLFFMPEVQGICNILCEPCLSGTYSRLGGTCTSCPPGSYNDQTSATVCKKCDAGKFSITSGATSSDTCPKCDKGKYSDVAGSTVCTDCPAGKYRSAFGGSAVTDCISCDAGKFSIDSGAISSDTCAQCFEGKYSNVAGSTECANCPAGKYRSALGGSAVTDCISCDAGTFSATLGAISSGTCAQCDKGKYSNVAGSTECANCPAGKYRSALGGSAVTDCINCDAGRFSIASGATSSDTCAQCFEGKYSNVAGSIECTDCPKGTYLSTKGAVSSNACTQCVIGKFSNVQGATLSSMCQTCGTGLYVDTTGATICKSCTAVQCDNTLYTKPCIATSNAACGNCDTDGSRPANADYSDRTNAACPWACNSGYFKNAAGTQCCVNCDNGLYNPQCAASKTACQACNN